MASKATDKPHALCIPFPTQSHITSMTKLAKLLHHKGFYITFVHTDYNHSLLLQSRGPDSLDGLPDFRFEKIPDILPPVLESADKSPEKLFVQLVEAIRNGLSLPPFSDLLVKIINGSTTEYSNYVPPLTCVISDFLLPFTRKAAEELGIPVAFFYPSSACSLMLSTKYAAVKEKGLLPVEDETFFTNDHLDKVVDGIPGMKDIRLRDFPRLTRSVDPNDTIIDAAIEGIESGRKVSAIILHTFDALEQEVVNTFHSTFPPVFPIGPLQLLLDQLPEDRQVNSIGYNLWKEEPECLQWLDSRKPNSVIFVSFGSSTFISRQQFIELGMGIANSNIPFLWAVRLDLVVGDEDSAILPPEFFEETKGRGFITSWCPQEDVLNHPSIGGFLMHSGWGSTIESISSGVPMICWPSFADQHIICRYTCKEWGIGMELESDINRENVEKLVRELMKGEKGKVMKEKAMEWKKLAQEATCLSGSSSMNLDNLVKKMLSGHA